MDSITVPVSVRAARGTRSITMVARALRRGTDGRLPAAAAPEEMIHQAPEEPARCRADVQAVHLESTAQRDRNRQRDSSDGRRGEVAEIPAFSRLEHSVDVDRLDGGSGARVILLRLAHDPPGIAGLGVVTE